jgi:hypothetical protein
MKDDETQSATDVRWSNRLSVLKHAPQRSNLDDALMDRLST